MRKSVFFYIADDVVFLCENESDLQKILDVLSS